MIKNIIIKLLVLSIVVGVMEACSNQDKRCKKNAKKIKELRKNNPNFTM